jgi:hypothetical protein
MHNQSSILHILVHLFSLCIQPSNQVQLDTNIGRLPKIQFPLKVYNTRFRARNMGHDKKTWLEMNHQKKLKVLKESSQNLLVSSVNF